MQSLWPSRLIRRVQRWFCRRQVALLAPLLAPDDQILDFGCGDGSLAEGLVAQVAGLQATGVDVIGADSPPSRVPVRTYDGTTLPFEDRSFDVVLAHHVFHHCDNPEAALRECCRVARRRVVVVEPTVRSLMDLPAMRFTDWLFNAWKPEPVPMPYHFQRRAQWRLLLQRCGYSVEREDRIGVFPSWLPIGETVLFLAVRNGKATAV